MAEDTVTTEKAVELLSQFLEADVGTLEVGACRYSAGGKQYCNNLTREQCNALNGAFLGGKCPGT